MASKDRFFLNRENGNAPVVSVDYYNTKGTLLKKYLPSPVPLKPLESIRYVVDYDDKAGGPGPILLLNGDLRIQ